MRNAMKVEHGERRGRNCCLVSKGVKGGKERGDRTQRVKPPFSISQEEMKTCVVTREGAFYSGVSIATVSMCPFYRPADLLLCSMWRKNTHTHKCQKQCDY